MFQTKKTKEPIIFHRYEAVIRDSYNRFGQLVDSETVYNHESERFFTSRGDMYSRHEVEPSTKFLRTEEEA